MPRSASALWLVDVERQAIEQRVLVDGRWLVRGTFAGGEPVRAEVFPSLDIAPGAVFPAD